MNNDEVYSNLNLAHWYMMGKKYIYPFKTSYALKVKCLQSLVSGVKFTVDQGLIILLFSSFFESRTRAEVQCHLTTVALRLYLSLLFLQFTNFDKNIQFVKWIR